MYKKYVIDSSLIGPITIIYKKNNDYFKIQEIILSNHLKNSKEIANDKYPNLKIESSKEIELLKNEIKNYLNSKDYEFSIKDLNLDQCSEFQRKVLIEQFKTKIGSTNTYKNIALKIGSENSSRAVGNALKNNPFPLIIPCHRTIKSNNEIGGFGGLNEENSFKSILLEHEGNIIKNNKIIKK